MSIDPALYASLIRFLPAPLLQRLPDVEALRESIQHLNGLHRAVASFLPLYIAEDEAQLANDFADLRPGTFLFADVSGFTALSEWLQRARGSEGAETLTEIINEYFAAMLEILAKSDAQLLKFAGDALLAFFPAGSDPTDLSDAQKAIRTGLRMQREIRTKFQPVQHERLREIDSSLEHQLTMSIGIARGKLFEALVGNSMQRDHIVQGDLPGLAMEAEGVGERDEVIIDAALAQIFADQMELKPLADGFFQVLDTLGDQLGDYEFDMLRRRRAKSSALFDLEQKNLLDSVAQQVGRVQVVSRYVAPTVLHDLINSENYHLRSEHRYTVTLFAHVTGFAEMLGAWGDEHLSLVLDILDRYYSIVQRIISSYGGTLARTDPYKQGIKLLVTFGAPVAHADDPERAVRTALEMHLQLAQFNERLLDEVPAALHRTPFITHRIGITQGLTFAGEVGWKSRREFTVMGDDVNLAARLMSKAQMGQTVISSRVYKRVASNFAAQALPPMMLKGKAEPVQAYVVTSEASSDVRFDDVEGLPFVGHDMFMLTLNYLLRAASSGRRRAVTLVGDAGIGKTRIAKQFAHTAETANFRVAWATCQVRNNAKTIWSTLMAQLLGVDLAQPIQEARAVLHQRLEAMGQLELESVLSYLLFDLVSPRGQKPAPAPSRQERMADIFKMVSEMSQKELKTSGMFGLARRRLEAASETGESSAESSDLWRTAEQRTSLPDGIVRCLDALTQDQPILLVIDDLHLAKPLAVDLLRHVLKHLTQARLFILATFEPVAALDIESQVLNVPDLSEDETYQVAMALLHADELGPRLRALLWERTSGRPLFIESLLRKLLDDHYIEQAQGRAELHAEANIEALPENVRELVISRIDRLEPEAQTVLRAAAVLEDSFTIPALKALLANDYSDAVEPILEHLINVQIIEETEKQVYDFRHGMTQRVIYESLSRAQRLKLHQAAVKYWRTKPSPQPIILAHHLVKCGLLPQAIEVMTQSAEAAEQRRDIDQALELYTHALSLFPDEKSIQVQIERLRQAQS